MKLNKKAILLSALVLPGLGQVSLKRYKRGMAIIFVSVFCLYNVMRIATEKANAIVNDILTQGGVMDMQAISQAADSSAYSQYVWIIAACWLLSLVDLVLFDVKTQGASK